MRKISSTTQKAEGIHPDRRGWNAFCRAMMIAGFLAPVGKTLAATSIPTPSGVPGSPTPQAASSSEEIQVLDAIDAKPNSSTASTTPVAGQAVSTALAAVSAYTPPTVPTGLNALILKEGVYLSWDAVAVTSGVTAYNVYRSTTPGSGYRLINLHPLTSPYFLDGAQNSIVPPQNDENYFYVIASIDPKGNVSPYSQEIAIATRGMEIPRPGEETKQSLTKAPEEETYLNVPENKIINLKLPADTQLTIQGHKTISAEFNFQKFNRDETNGVPSFMASQAVSQELVVNLDGKVGKNVDVHVDYSDVNRPGSDLSKQEISILYHGNADSPIQEVAFGDLQLFLPNTEFAGFSKQLFGLQAKLKLDHLRFTSFFAQTKGISETKVFTGNYTKVDKIIKDVDYIRLRYFLMTKKPYPSAGVTIPDYLPVPSSEQIWVNQGNGQTNPSGDPAYFNGFFERFLPGRDYTVDYATGVITFLRAIGPSCQIAVAFLERGGGGGPVSIGFDGSGNTDLTPATLITPDDGVITSAQHLLKDNNNGISSPNATALSPLCLVNYFDLGREKIIPPQQDPDFLFEIIDQGTNTVLQSGQSASTRWAYDLNQDLNLLSVRDTTNAVFPERAFANPDGGLGPNGVYSQTTTPASLKQVHLKYKTKLDFFRLDRFNIIRGSEAVFLDRRRLRRDADYFFDYSSGVLDFPDKSILRPDSEIVVTYEYAPFGSGGQNNILGARAEYDLTDRFFLGSTFLMSTSQTPQDTPQLGSTPNSLALFDADARYDITSDDIQAITSVIPGLENWKPPLSLKLSGEVAQSYFNPDTFEAEGEKGVAMVDNMEGVDNVTGTAMVETAWLASSKPQTPPTAFTGLPFVAYSASGDAGNNRVRFTNGTDNLRVLGLSTADPNTPGYGGHTFASTGKETDRIPVLQFPYSHLTDQRWGGVRNVISTSGTDLSNVRFFQSWVYNDGASKDKWIMFDFGSPYEDSNGSGQLDKDPNFGTANQADPSYGVPTYYFPGNPYTGSATIPFIGNSNDSSSQEGYRIGRATNYVTEDINGNAALDSTDTYYEYGVRANWSGWKLVKIPVNLNDNDKGGTTSEGVSFFFHKQGIPNPTAVHAVRVWATGTGPAEINGAFALENISFTRNLWQLDINPDANVNQGVTVDTSKFDVNSISQDQDPRYNPSLRFITIPTGSSQTASTTLKEKSLKLTYKLSADDLEPRNDLVNGRAVYYATRLFSQGLDFTDFQELRFDLQIKSYTPGEVFFVRLGTDPKNYYQYNVPLTSVTSTSLNSWGTVIIPLDGSGGNLVKVGSPFLNRAVQLSVGVISLNAAVGTTGELWVNNLRLVSPADRAGLARRANATVIFGDNFATLSGRYREVDSGFTQMDQTSTHFLHSKQIGADFSSSSVKVFSQPLVTTLSASQQETTTEDALRNNPYFIDKPSVHLETTSGNISYTKDFGDQFGRLTSLRLSGSTLYESDSYQPAYLSQPGLVIQGDQQKWQEKFTVASTFDAPTKLFSIPIGTNQFTQSFDQTYDRQTFSNAVTYSPYRRTTRVQNYGWINTTEIVKNLVFTPGYNLSLTDAEGNTNNPGVTSVEVPNRLFQRRDQPRGKLDFHGIPGFTPSVDYSGSNQTDYVGFQDGIRFTNANNLNYSLQVTPGDLLTFLPKIGLTVTGGRTESSTASIPDFGKIPTTLTFAQQWLITDPKDFKDIALTATRSIGYHLNGSFRLFDTWDFSTSGSWTDQLNLLTKGTDPTTLNSRTLAFNTGYNRRIFTLPLVDFSLNSAQLQYTRTDSLQYSSTNILDTSANTDSFLLTLPYEVAQVAQGNIRLQRDLGYRNTRGSITNERRDQASVEYNQKFAPNLELHIPFTNLKIKLQDAIEFRAGFLMEFVNNESPSLAANNKRTRRYRGSIDLNYNALKNLRIGIGLVNEYYHDELVHSGNFSPNDYSLWRGTISADARF